VLLLGQMPATLSQHLNNMHYDYEVDATGLKCPLPILRCKKGLNEIKSDQVLKIIATDPGSKKDFDAFCRQTGHELLSLQANFFSCPFNFSKLSSNSSKRFFS
jgi:tRNA 2-thiouridine synthesizing protein A